MRVQAESRPTIGLVADRRMVTVGAWCDLDGTLVPQSYVSTISRAGGLPVVLPVDEALAEDPEQALAGIDGLVMIGGRDVDADAYGQPSHPENDQGDALGLLRDQLEMIIARTALEHGIPILGACRGVQILNIVLGGDLEQHLGDRLDLKPHRDQPGAFARHTATAVAGTRVAAILGDGPFDVSSHHHQGLGRLGDGLVVAAHAHDGVIEAVEMPEASFCVGVLWHPEEDLNGTGLSLFRALVDAARDRRSTPAEASDLTAK